MKTLYEFLNTNKKQPNNYIDTINFLKEIFEEVFKNGGFKTEVIKQNNKTLYRFVNNKDNVNNTKKIFDKIYASNIEYKRVVMFKMDVYIPLDVLLKDDKNKESGIFITDWMTERAIQIVLVNNDKNIKDYFEDTFINNFFENK